VCALPVPLAPATSATKPRAQILRCTECGAAIAFDPHAQAPACGFCRAVMAIEQPLDPIETAQLRLPFTVDRDHATERLRTWLGQRGFFAPKALRDDAVFESLTPLCWAAWIVNARAQVAWTADSDHGSERSAWAPHSGQVPLDFTNIVVPASRGLRHEECAALVPYYDLGHAVGASTASEPAMIESFDAQRSAAREHVHHAIESIAKVRVEEVVPGRKFRNIHVACLLEGQTTDRVALPAWVLAYRYRGSPYRAVVHGQNAEIVHGTSPTDWAKVAMVVLAIAAGVLAVVAAIALAR
jgi:hypothetical protein